MMIESVENNQPTSEPLVTPETTGSAAQIHISVDLAPGAKVRITVEALTDRGDPAGASTVLVDNPGTDRAPISINLPAQPALPSLAANGGTVVPAGDPARRLVTAAAGWTARIYTRTRARGVTLPWVLFGAALLAYLLSRLVGLAQFPIYFFTDEAVQTVLAADFVRDGFRNYDKIFLPTYFRNGYQYNLGVSVYLQILPTLLFGKSVYITRLVPVLVSLFGAASISLILRDFFHSRYWWAGALLLSIAPAWFLHSRTAFETVLMASFYAAMMYAYLLYRCRSPRYLYPTLVLAALAFYSYSPGQMVVGLTGLLLLVSDARYHWENRRVVLKGLALVALLALPYVRFRLTNPVALHEHLANLGSYWVQPLPLAEKIGSYWREYLYGMSPAYWFIPNDRDLVRHLMKGYGHLWIPTLPFAVWGLVVCLKNIRVSAYRVVLLALLAAPSGAALVQAGITRTLVFVIPATLLTALGLSALLARVEKIGLPYRAVSITACALLVLINGVMLRDALRNGPTWYTDYGLGGMQYGAQPLFGAVQEYLGEHPGSRIKVSPVWANGTDVLARFFSSDPLPFTMESIEGYLNRLSPVDANTIFVLTPEEYEQIQSSGKFTDIQVDQTLPYPDGRPGFYFLRMQYVADIESILAAEAAERRKLQEAQVVVDGEPARVLYSLLDMGSVEDMFDGSLDTLARTFEANPFIIDLVFAEARQVEGLMLKFGSTEADVRIQVKSSPEAEPHEYQDLLRGTVEQPQGILRFPEPVDVHSLHLEVTDTRQEEPGNVHIWEIELIRPDE